MGLSENKQLLKVLKVALVCSSNQECVSRRFTSYTSNINYQRYAHWIPHLTVN